MQSTEDSYDLEWFKNRAKSSVHKMKEGIVDYSDMVLVYLPTSGQEYEQQQETGTLYHKHITAPEHKFVAGIASDLAKSLPPEFEFIDLGPGSEHKEKYLFDELNKLGKKFVYRPVDINAKFLSLANDYAKQQSIPVSPLLCCFEDLHLALGKTTIPRFFSLGLTVVGYDPEVIFDLLKKMAGENAYIYISIQLRDRVDMEVIRKAYEECVEGFFDDKFRLIGLDPTKDVQLDAVDDGVRVWYKLLNSNEELEKKNIMQGDRMLVAQSLRHTKEHFVKKVSEHFENFQVFDIDSTFLGVLLKV